MIYTFKDLAQLLFISYRTVKKWRSDPEIVIPTVSNPSGSVEVLTEDAVEEICRVYERYGKDGLRKGLHLPRYELRRVRE
jgi:predicted site-specific integrase-resolvase